MSTRALPGLGQVRQPDRAERQGADRDRQDQREQPAPVEHAEHEPRDGRPDRRGDRDDDGDVAHRAAAARGRGHGHDGGHEQREHDRRAARLHDAADDERVEPGRQRADRGAQAEQGHRREEHGARGEPLDHEAGDGDDDRHRQHERRGHPLGGARRDVQVAHQPGERDAHDRLVEDDDERRDQQQADGETVAHAGSRSRVRGRVGRGQGLVGHGSTSGVGGKGDVAAGVDRRGRCAQSVRCGPDGSTLFAVRRRVVTAPSARTAGPRRVPKRAIGWAAARSSASSRSAHSSTSNPAMDSCVSANGPSVTSSCPERTRTVRASCGGPQPVADDAEVATVVLAHPVGDVVVLGAVGLGGRVVADQEQETHGSSRWWFEPSSDGRSCGRRIDTIRRAVF